MNQSGGWILRRIIDDVLGDSEQWPDAPLRIFS